eukprot:TRINITY_DN1356_c0_g1_i7.p1 TRINITY_DN1356_c0_g1~~TRINITY_DN1356_c0_g1_i7.p1  ORF type:complete len:1030 (-),score=434.26 TRINITY_DN1356_c0_g1_i7:75-3164(-)
MTDGWMNGCCSDKIESEDDRSRAAAFNGYLLRKVPEINVDVIERLLFFLHKINQRESENGMDSQLLGELFGHVFVRPSSWKNEEEQRKLIVEMFKVMLALPKVLLMDPTLRAVLTIQNNWRSTLARRQMKLERGAAARVATLAWLKIRFMVKLDDMRQKRAKEALDALEREKATREIQRMMKGYVTRKYYQKRLVTGKMIPVKPQIIQAQALARGFLVRKRMERGEYSMEHLEVVNAATRIQAVFRGKKGRDQYEQAKYDHAARVIATRLPAMREGFRARKKVAEMREHEELVQKVTVLQAHARGKFAKKRVRMIKKGKEVREQRNAAVLIQRRFRSHAEVKKREYDEKLAKLKAKYESQNMLLILCDNCEDDMAVYYDMADHANYCSVCNAILHLSPEKKDNPRFRLQDRVVTSYVSATDYPNGSSSNSVRESHTKLDFANMGLNVLPTGVTMFMYLEELDVSGNDLTYLHGDIGDLSSLRQLRVGNNQLKSLPVEIKRLSALELLDASNNEIEEIPREIQGCHRLRTLDLSNNALSELPEEIGELRLLQFLSVHENELETIPINVRQMRNLKTADFSYNLLTNLSLGICRLKMLESLDVSHNKLTSLGNKNIRFMASLQSVDASYNQLTSLPEEMSELHDLTMLNVSYNQLTELPVCLVKLGKLVDLRVNNNEISFVPSEYSELVSQLSRFEFANNSIVLPSGLHHSTASKKLQFVLKNVPNPNAPNTHDAAEEQRRVSAASEKQAKQAAQAHAKQEEDKQASKQKAVEEQTTTEEEKEINPFSMFTSVFSDDKKETPEAEEEEDEQDEEDDEDEEEDEEVAEPKTTAEGSSSDKENETAKEDDQAETKSKQAEGEAREPERKQSKTDALLNFFGVWQDDEEQGEKKTTEDEVVKDQEQVEEEIVQQKKEEPVVEQKQPAVKPVPVQASPKAERRSSNERIVRTNGSVAMQRRAHANASRVNNNNSNNSGSSSNTGGRRVIRRVASGQRVVSAQPRPAGATTTTSSAGVARRTATRRAVAPGTARRG